MPHCSVQQHSVLDINFDAALIVYGDKMIAI